MLLLYGFAACIGGLLALWLLERMIAVAIHWTGTWLPRDVVGPEGWLIDTKSQVGVFDRRV